MHWLPQLLYSQLFVKLPYPTTSFAGQTIIVTGANTGLGLEAARHIVRLGAAKVILAVRTRSKGEAAARDILESTKATKTVVEVWEVDLSKYASVIAFAERAKGLDRLDAVLQNAGILTMKYGQAEDNEAIITVNYVSAVLLGLLVLPKLRESAEKYGSTGRLAFVGSDVIFMTKFKEAETSGPLFEALNRKEGIDMGDRYGVSKVLLQYAIREIAARSPITPKSNVIITDLTPGACKSDIFRDEFTAILRVAKALIDILIARSTEVGGRALVHGVDPKLGQETHGAFLMDCKVKSPGSRIESEKGHSEQAKFTKELFAKLESISPGVTSVLN